MDSFTSGAEEDGLHAPLAAWSGGGRWRLSGGWQVEQLRNEPSLFEPRLGRFGDSDERGAPAGNM
jgi:hypothetical protein